ncbi:nucleoside diphosphate kinase, mitochondrial isoform X1 [Entelurus aequoreus]|uniref:nucleoside diphosphate kinase, mitochondrial isoform X1 n=2 Tax=Entelurus aequoreus TaxID=161455 RepID=UPI002B1E3A7C|nr:nucleoside diphosphate kinase, mitochondrial isoform X1 [Entelurus aequoreus]
MDLLCSSSPVSRQSSCRGCWWSFQPPFLVFALLSQPQPHLLQRAWSSVLVPFSSPLPLVPPLPDPGLRDVKERTLVAVKPDGVQRRLVGQIIRRFEQRGFKLVGLKMLQVSEELLSQHYCQLTQKAFYPSLVQYMTSAPVVVMVWEGHNVVQASRVMVGPTNPSTAQAGTVRGDFSLHVSRNVVHASDSLEGAEREIQLWFQGKELLKWECWDQTITCEE